MKNNFLFILILLFSFLISKSYSDIRIIHYGNYTVRADFQEVICSDKQPCTIIKDLMMTEIGSDNFYPITIVQHYSEIHITHAIEGICKIFGFNSALHGEYINYSELLKSGYIWVYAMKNAQNFSLMSLIENSTPEYSKIDRYEPNWFWKKTCR